MFLKILKYYQIVAHLLCFFRGLSQLMMFLIKAGQTDREFRVQGGLACV